MKVIKTIAIAGVSVMAIMLSAACGASKPQTAALSLASNPSTGYAWTVEQDNDVFDITSEYVEDEENEGLAGAGGTEVFTLTPKKSGTAKVTFRYQRDWEEEEEPAATLRYELKVSMSKKIKTISMTADMPGEIDTLPDIPELKIE